MTYAAAALKQVLPCKSENLHEEICFPHLFRKWWTEMFCTEVWALPKLTAERRHRYASWLASVLHL